jgi:hypothetical protein
MSDEDLRHIRSIEQPILTTVQSMQYGVLQVRLSRATLSGEEE